MARRGAVNIFIDPNPNCPEGCGSRFETTGAPRRVTAILYPAAAGESVACDVSGWSSAGGGSACAAWAVPVEDSGAGVSTLVYGGDWGLRLTPRDGREAFGQPYLLLDAEAVIGPDAH